jgi:hypothetical protein
VEILSDEEGVEAPKPAKRSYEFDDVRPLPLGLPACVVLVVYYVFVQSCVVVVLLCLCERCCACSSVVVLMLAHVHVTKIPCVDICRMPWLGPWLCAKGKSRWTSSRSGTQPPDRAEYFFVCVCLCACMDFFMLRLCHLRIPDCAGGRAWGLNMQVCMFTDSLSACGEFCTCCRAML